MEEKSQFRQNPVVTTIAARTRQLVESSGFTPADGGQLNGPKLLIPFTAPLASALLFSSISADASRQQAPR
jgi:hypothetical protein